MSEKVKKLSAGQAGIEPELPAENIGEEIIPIAIGTAEQTVVPLAEAAAFAQPQTTNYKPQTEDMEVHHHTHPDSHRDHGKKNWKAYFWEFLMLFLAVFCGFLAEYQLEHYIEKQRAKDFAVSLHRDICADTLVINNTIKRLNICVQKIDTLISLLGQPEAIEKNTPSIYILSLYAFVMPVNTPNESTMQQLLNSGSLRYFKNNALVDSVKLYNTDIQLLKSFSENAGTFNIEFRKMQVRIIEINPLLEYFTKNNFSISLESGETNTDFFNKLKMMSGEVLMLKEYANWCALKKFYLINSVDKYRTLKEQAVVTLQLLSKYYHLP
jgi:hypothetical protein